MNREGPGKIGYLDFVWNPIVGCTNGCSYCWARRQAKRQRKNCQTCYDFKPHLHPERLDEPLRKREPLVIGVAFMGDLFDPEINGEMLARCFEVMQACPRHTFVVLTKQAKRMRAECETLFGNWFVRFPNGILPNVVLGVSVEDQESADRLIPELLECPAATRIVSIEPMRGPADMSRWVPVPDVDGHCSVCGCEWDPEDVGSHECPPGFSRLDGVILGGQTGPGAPPMHPDWARAVRDQCAEAGVPFFFKQWGEWAPLDQHPDHVPLQGSRNVGHFDARSRFSSGIGCFTLQHLVRVGRKAAGRMLDGRTHDGLAWGPKPVRSAE